MKLIHCVPVFALLASACGYPNYSMAMRQNTFPGDAVLEGTCNTYTSMDEEALARDVPNAYKNGYRLAFADEYTSSAKFGHEIVVCFERVKR
jgi:hypothetical protein